MSRHISHSRVVSYSKEIEDLRKHRIYGKSRTFPQGEIPREKTAFLKAKKKNIYIPSIESVERVMTRKCRALPSRHLGCASCSSWVQFDRSGCTKSWAEMSRGACACTCKGCREVVSLVGEVGDLRQMVDSMKMMMIRGQGLEEQSRDTGDQVTRR